MAQAFLFRFGSLDLSQYVRVGPQDGLDPYGQGWLDPQFADGPFAEGQPLLNVDAKNREQAWPMFLKDTSKDALNALKIAIDREIAKRPLMVEWRDSGSTKSTFYDVEYARLDEKFNYRLSDHEYADAGLRVWCRPPYGHTGTTRVVASAVGQTPVLTIPIASLAGDVPALAKYDVTVPQGPNALQGATHFLAVSVLPNASYQVEFTAASYGQAVTANATRLNDANVAGSQYIRYANPTIPHRVCEISPSIPSAYVGLNRILMIYRSTATAGFYVSEENGAFPTRLATSMRWAIMDLGTFEVPTDMPAMVDLFLDVSPNGAGASGNAFDFNDIIILPDERTSVTLHNSDSNSHTLDGTINKSYSRSADVSSRILFTDATRRGGIPALDPGAVTVAVVAAPMPGASAGVPPVRGSGSAVVSVRERFTFAR